MGVGVPVMHEDGNFMLLSSVLQIANASCHLKLLLFESRTKSGCCRMGVFIGYAYSKMLRDMRE